MPLWPISLIQLLQIMFKLIYASHYMLQLVQHVSTDLYLYAYFKKWLKLELIKFIVLYYISTIFITKATLTV